MKSDIKSKLYPIEVLIFSGVCMIFMNSVYNLFTDGKLASDGKRAPIAMRPAATEADRGLASSSGGVANFVPYETKCAPTGEVFETGAAKIRILGPFCGAPAPTRQTASDDAATPSPAHETMHDTIPAEYRIENTTSHYLATVFSDYDAEKFSTDFIPLENGANKIRMEFRYKNGHMFPVDLTIVKK